MYTIHNQYGLPTWHLWSSGFFNAFVGSSSEVGVEEFFASLFAANAF
jgi:hypothetical protein